MDKDKAATLWYFSSDMPAWMTEASQEEINLKYAEHRQRGRCASRTCGKPLTPRQLSYHSVDYHTLYCSMECLAKGEGSNVAQALNGEV